MDRAGLKRLLEGVRQGRIDVAEALEALRRAPLERLGWATLDLQRAVRRGFPEVVYGPGKTTAQIVEIVGRLRAAGQVVLVTRVGPEEGAVLARQIDDAAYHPVPRALTAPRKRMTRGRPGVVVVTAGTSDVPVAEEAALTAEMMGNRVERLYDVGVAGLHRLLARRDTLLGARVLVVVAGMEGALPSVIAGLTDVPVIGVPTSVGYGAGAPGEAALMSMLHSCAGGLTVVNIDNGFGAGFAAGLINDPPRRRGLKIRDRVATRKHKILTKS